MFLCTALDHSRLDEQALLYTSGLETGASAMEVENQGRVVPSEAEIQDRASWASGSASEFEMVQCRYFASMFPADSSRVQLLS